MFQQESFKKLSSDITQKILTLSNPDQDIYLLQIHDFCRRFINNTITAETLVIALNSLHKNYFDCYQKTIPNVVTLINELNIFCKKLPEEASKEKTVIKQREESLKKLCTASIDTDPDELLKMTVMTFTSAADPKNEQFLQYFFNSQCIPKYFCVLLQTHMSLPQISKSHLIYFLNSSGITNPIIVNYLLYYFNTLGILGFCRTLIQKIDDFSQGEVSLEESQHSCNINSKNAFTINVCFNASLGLKKSYTDGVTRTVATAALTLIYDLVVEEDHMICCHPTLEISGESEEITRIQYIFNAYLEGKKKLLSFSPITPRRAAISLPNSPARPIATRHRSPSVDFLSDLPPM